MFASKLFNFVLSSRNFLWVHEQWILLDTKVYKIGGTLSKKKKRTGFVQLMNSDFSWKGGASSQKITSSYSENWLGSSSEKGLSHPFFVPPPPTHTTKKNAVWWTFIEGIIEITLPFACYTHIHRLPRHHFWRAKHGCSRWMLYPNKKKIVQLWMKNQKEFTNVRNLSSKHRVYSLLQQYVHRF